MPATEKSPEAFRTISEVARWLDTPAHVLRFWESRFPEIAPVKGAGGRRYYRPEDMRLLGGIKRLLHDEGHTIKAVQQRLAADGPAAVAAQSPDLPTGAVAPPASHPEAEKAPASAAPAEAVPAEAEQEPPIGFFFDDTAPPAAPPRADGAAPPDAPEAPALPAIDHVAADPADTGTAEALLSAGPQDAAWLRGSDPQRAAGRSELRALAARLEQLRGRLS